MKHFPIHHHDFKLKYEKSRGGVNYRVYQCECGEEQDAGQEWGADEVILDHASYKSRFDIWWVAMGVLVGVIIILNFVV